MSLNPDAIYEAIVVVHSYAASDEGAAAVREVLRDESRKIDKDRRLNQAAFGPEAVSYPIPKIDPTPDLCESIFPGERASVEYGLDLGCKIVFGPSTLLAEAAQDDGPSGEAVRRYIAQYKSQ